MEEKDKKVVWISSRAQNKLRRAADKMGITQGELLARLIYDTCRTKEEAE